MFLFKDILRLMLGSQVKAWCKPKMPDRPEMGTGTVEKSMSYKHLPAAERRVVFATWKQWQLYPVPKHWVEKAIEEALINFRSN